MSTSQRVIKNTGYLYIRLGITMFISLYTTRIILNSLGENDYGIFSLIGSSISILNFFYTTMSDMTQRFISYSEGEGSIDKIKQVFNVSTIIHVSIGIISCILLLIFGYFLFDGILNIQTDRIYAAKVVFASFIISTLFTVVSVPYNAIITAHENMLYFALVGILESVLKLFVAIYIIYSPFDKLIVYGILMACIPIILWIIMGIYCHKHYEECMFHPRRYCNKNMVKQMLSFSGWTFTVNASGGVTFYTAGIILNRFFGAILNTAQGIAIQISGQLMVFANNMLKAINPVIVKCAGEKNLKSMNEISLAGCKYSFFLLAFIAIPFLFEANYILKLWLKIFPEFTVIFCQLQVIRVLIEQLTRSLNTSISAVGKIKGFSVWKTIINIIPLFIAPILFICGYKPYWIHIVWIICWGILGSAVHILYAHNKCQLRFQDYTNKVLYPCILITALTCIPGILINIYMEESLFRLMLTLSSCLIIFFLSVWFIGLSKQESQQFVGFIYAKIRAFRRNSK